MHLISRSCTSGWFDWTWGDLWLTEDALVRVTRGRDEARRAAVEYKQQGGGSTVGPNPGAEFVPGPAELRDRVAGSERNRWIELGEIRQARLRRGIKNGRLAVVMRDGSRVKLLWLKDDPAHDVLHTVLVERLGEKLTVR